MPMLAVTLATNPFITSASFVRPDADSCVVQLHISAPPPSNDYAAGNAYNAAFAFLVDAVDTQLKHATVQDIIHEDRSVTRSYFFTSVRNKPATAAANRLITLLADADMQQAFIDAEASPAFIQCPLLTETDKATMLEHFGLSTARIGQTPQISGRE